MDRVLPCTLRPKRASEFFALAEEQHGGSHKALVAKLLELSQRHCIRKCPEAGCKHDKAIVCKGRKGYGLAIFVFTYDQRIPTSLWDHHTVLCRGLTVITCLPEHLNVLEDGASLELGILDAATKSTEIPLEIAECMPKFFESDPATVQGLKCFSAEELRLEAVLEKVDGSLGLLHPARDPKTLEIVDGLPLISSKSVGFSEDIVQVRTMLEEKHPNFRLPKGVTALIVEVVRPEVQVCVPYSYQGFRMLAVMKDGAWLSEDAVDDIAQELGMERPKRMNFAALRPGGYGDGDEPSLADVIAKAEAYVMSDNPHELEEGWVVVMRNGLRLKVHTEVWNMLHAWWSNRITLKTVLPLLEDARINQVPFDNIRECLCGPAATAKRHQNADALKAMLEQLRPIYEECKKDARQALRETSRDSLKALKNHPMAKVFQMVRGRRGWADAIPEEVDIESLPLANEVIRCLFLPRAEHAEREMQEELDAAAVEGVKAKPLRAVLMCLEMQPATLKQLEADLQKAIPEELLPLISAKGGLIAPDARNRLHAVLQRRRSYRDI